MNCKYCNANVRADFKLCPYCGKALSDADEQVFELFPPKDEQKKKVWPLVLAIIGGVTALAALAVVLLLALGVDLMPRENTILKKDNYTVSDKKAVNKAETVIATMGDRKLTNAQLQIYYFEQVTDFLNYYGSYASYMGLDYTKPLSEQTCYYDESLTWEQYFINIAVETWQRYQAIGALAEEAGHVMSEDWQKAFDEMPADLLEQAKDSGYDTVDELLQNVIGPNCNQTNYLEFIRLNFFVTDYFKVISENLRPTEDEVNAYFTENEAVFKEQGITKESGLISAVRHILVCPEGGTTDETTGKVTYSETQWAACYAQAEKILKEWKDGEATSESFGTLVETYTKDEGSKTTGGLYEGIYKGSGMTEAFEAWAIDAERKVGDVGIVKADYDHYQGYHIMYFVEGEPHWSEAAETQLLSDRCTELVNAEIETLPFEITYGKIALGEIGF